MSCLPSVYTGIVFIITHVYMVYVCVHVCICYDVLVSVSVSYQLSFPKYCSISYSTPTLHIYVTMRETYTLLYTATFSWVL